MNNVIDFQKVLHRWQREDYKNEKRERAFNKLSDWSLYWHTVSRQVRQGIDKSDRE